MASTEPPEQNQWTPRKRMNPMLMVLLIFAGVYIASWVLGDPDTREPAPAVDLPDPGTLHPTQKLYYVWKVVQNDHAMDSALQNMVLHWYARDSVLRSDSLQIFHLRNLQPGWDSLLARYADSLAFEFLPASNLQGTLLGHGHYVRDSAGTWIAGDNEVRYSGALDLQKTSADKMIKGH